MTETVPDQKPTHQELHQQLDLLLKIGGTEMADRIAEYFARLQERPTGKLKSFRPGRRRN